MRKDDVEFADYEQLEDDEFFDTPDSVDYVEVDDMELDEKILKDLRFISNSYLSRFSLRHLVLSFIVEECYSNTPPMFISGILNLLYGITMGIASAFFTDLLNQFQYWFEYSFSILFVLIAIDYFSYYLYKSRREVDLAGFYKIRFVFYFFMALSIFWFPEFMTSSLLGLVGLISIVLGLSFIFQRDYYLELYRDMLVGKAIGITFFLIGIILIILPRFSMFYYHIAVAVIVGLRGIVQLYISFYYRKVDRVAEKLANGFTDYIIE